MTSNDQTIPPGEWLMVETTPTGAQVQTARGMLHTVQFGWAPKKG